VAYEPYSNERGILATSFWGAMESKLTEPEMAALVDRPEFDARLSEETGKLIHDVGERVFETMMSSFSQTVAANQKIRRNFEATVERVWGKPLNLMHGLYGICTEVGQDFNVRYRDRAYDEHDYSCQALIRIHARACLVFSEICSLLRSGHASGAYARWRTLHELAVVASFLREHDDDVARRYLEHDSVQIYKAALMHRRYADRINEEPPTDEEFERAKRDYDDLVAKYGREFKRDYGWAASVLPDDGRTFAEVELATKMDHMRPYYRMASHAIHPNARGLFFDLGVGDDEDLMLAGPSTRGMADPGMGATIALFQTTVSLLNERPDVDEVVTMLVLQRLVPQIEDSLIEASNAHDKEAERRREERDGFTPGIPSDHGFVWRRRLGEALAKLGIHNRR
jgi:hypothetical protein